VLVAGVSTRAAAESAARAGFRVTAIDAFADLDQHPSVTARAVTGRFSAAAAARAGREVECDAVAYLSSFENHPRAVAALAAGRTLWGNPPEVLRRVRDPRLLAQSLLERGFSVPRVVVPEPGTLNQESGQWLLKPLASGGGRRVRRWRSGSRVPRGRYLQEFVDGAPGSVVFVSASRRSVPLGISRQIVGEQAFGAEGFQYCGSILLPGETHGDALALARAVGDAFDLTGVNGVDFINHHGRSYAIEINPRWSASMELVEYAYGLSVFGTHAAACAHGQLPDFDLSAARRSVGAVGKAVVFARRDVVVGDTSTWLPAPPALPIPPALPALRDIPRSGDRIAAGGPVCTVFASGLDEADCHAALVQRARDVYAALAVWNREVA
jgi:predicted ATP-grasp superfamily ATP-dependent carboligase